MRIGNAPGRVNLRRIRVLKYLMSQRRSLERVLEDAGFSIADEASYNRVMKDIGILEKRIVPQEVAEATRRKRFRGAR